MNAQLVTPIAIRAYSERSGRKPLGSRPPSAESRASEWTLVFDGETTVDAAQSLRFGSFQVRNGEILEREGFFFDCATVTPDEEATIRSYADARRIELVTIAEFRTGVFLKYGYVRQGIVVGFNLPFDISRIAVSHGSARREMRGGFSFDLTGNGEDPRVRVKHLSPRAALIDFGVPGEQETTRAWRDRSMRVPAYRGHFVDIKTLASALLSRRFSLKTLAEHLRTPTQKHETDDHGTMTESYLDYARADAQVTWECFRELMHRYDGHGLSKSADRMLSEASIGKAYLQQMGIKPLLGCAPESPRECFGEIFCAYYGGRSEVRIRREIVEILYCDFKSMYPTVNSLMGIWDFVIADGFTVHNSTAETQEFLDSVTIEQLQQPLMWRKLCTLVRLRPDQDAFPVRAKYNDGTYTIGLNRLSSEEPLWFTLADCVVSKLQTGKSPRIDLAQTYRPGARQDDLKPVKVLGRNDYRIDPATDDFFRCLIDLRDEAKESNDSIEQTLKIIANSTSYGIFIEVNRDDAPKSEALSVYGPNSEHKEIDTKAIEDPGRYFHPLLGVLITGAARLMLGIAERRVIDSGLEWAFCDTDSLAIVRPKKISRSRFHKLTH